VRWPEGEGIRVDSGVQEGQEVTPYYDPMLAKVIAHGPTRKAALERLAAALRSTAIAGPRTNLAFLRALVASPAMVAGKVDTGLIERDLATLALVRPPDHAAAAKAVEELVKREQTRVARRAARRSDERRSPWNTADAFGLGSGREVQIAVQIDGQPARARLRFGANGPRATVEGKEAVDCQLIDADGGLAAIGEDGVSLIRLGDAKVVDLDHLDTDGVVSAPMHGKVLAIEVKVGDRVTKGQRLAVVEAMKMEHALNAFADGTVTEVAVDAGSQVAEGARLIVIKESQLT
jgi:3-methylcrotonyl-CoA carboxylase alpha subunit